MIEKITVKTKKQTIELDYEEAKELFSTLGDMLGKKDYHYYTPIHHIDPCPCTPLPQTPIYPFTTCMDPT